MVVVGGGIVGVELAAEIAAAHPSVRVTLVSRWLRGRAGALATRVGVKCALQCVFLFVFIYIYFCCFAIELLFAMIFSS